jgi:hypothetical protein
VYRTVKKYLALIGLLGALLSAPFAAYTQDNKEYLIKAAMINQFMLFTEWPGGNAALLKSIDICILGSSPISTTGTIFKEASEKYNITLSLVEEKDAQNAAKHCHIVFIGKVPSMSDTLAALKGKPVLTVSDAEDFAEQGGMIGFVIKDNQPKFKVNTKSANEAGLRIDPQVLELALKTVDR